MEAKIQDILKPEILNTIKGLEFVAKTFADGFLHGLNKSYALGLGQQFSQYRSYEPGDDLRLLDWKIYARSERYYTKLAEVETNIKVKFLLDASASMQHKESTLDKLQYAKIIIASLGYLAHQQGDQIGFYAINNNQIQAFPPKIQRQFSNFLFQIIDIDSKGKWPVSFDHFDDSSNGSMKEMIVVITDLYEESGEIFSFLKKIKSRYNEVLVFQVLGQDEVNFNYDGMLTFQDLENLKKVKVNTAKARKIYLDRIIDHQEKIRHELLNIGVHWEQFTMGEPLDDALAAFLKRRQNIL